ncbi:MAG: Histidinol-phosphate aminotransferase 2 [Syntrophorhabdaceae bacterium PtaU1.Bin034]|nr:MAG: Histidinol-phosphate aminotransferase 2 [Syntrophorhabdaceae bacterium PtaU1.Bin034]
MKLSIDPSVRNIPYYPKAALYGADEGWTRLSSNENPYPPSPKVVESLVNAVFDLNRYPESEFALKSLLAKKYGIKPQNILIGNGSNEIIETSLRAMKHNGRNQVMISDPSFAFYSIASSIYGYQTVSVPLDSLQLNLKSILERIDEKTRVIFLCNPNNPTGTIFDDRSFRSFLESLPPEVLVVVDEAYAEFSDNKEFPKSISYIDRHPVLILRTFSKAYGLAGLRVGYGIGEESLVSFLERTKQPFSVNMMALIAAKAALGDESHLKKVLDNNRKGKKYLYDTLGDMGVEFFPSEANFVLIKLGTRAEAITRSLFEKRVLIRWLGGYGLADYVRVTVGTMNENRVFTEALKRLVP